MSITTQWGIQLHLDALTFPANWFWSPFFFFLNKIYCEFSWGFICNKLSCEMTWCGQQWESIQVGFVGRTLVVYVDLLVPHHPSEKCVWSRVYLGASHGCGKAERFWSLLPSPLMDQEWEGFHGATGSQIASTPRSGGLGARYLGKF